MPEFDLTTEAGIAAALARARALRLMLRPGEQPGADATDWLLATTIAALGRLRPQPQPIEPDTRPVPPWLRKLQEEDDSDA